MRQASSTLDESPTHAQLLEVLKLCYVGIRHHAETTSGRDGNGLGDVVDIDVLQLLNGLLPVPDVAVAAGLDGCLVGVDAAVLRCLGRLPAVALLVVGTDVEVEEEREEDDGLHHVEGQEGLGDLAGREEGQLRHEGEHHDELDLEK